jgi:hypothetical protein
VFSTTKATTVTAIPKLLPINFVILALKPVTTTASPSITVLSAIVITTIKHSIQ